jgi:hypothetical protein
MMNDPIAQIAPPPFSYLVKVGHISANPVQVRISADADERKGLAELWDVLSVESLTAEIQVSRWKRDGVRLKGVVRANLTQACIVTLEPVTSQIEEMIDQVFLPETSKLAKKMLDPTVEFVLDPSAPDIPETFPGDAVDAGAIVAEFAALAIEPYPRAPGAVFEDHIESTEETDVKPSPFALLKDWKKD